MHLAVLSPHLDDAALSCVGRLMEARREGVPVRIMNIFTRCGSERAEHYEQRQANDRSFAHALGADSCDLGLLDAPFRPGYSSFSDILCADERSEESLAVSLASSLDVEIRKLESPLVLAPLGVGNHIDHRLTFRASMKLARAGHRVEHYEDRPYGLVKHAVKMRLKRLGAWDDHIPGEKYISSLKDAPYMKKVAASRDDWKRVADNFRREEDARTSAYDASSHTFSWPEDALAEAWSLISSYETEIPWLYPARDIFMKAMKEYAEEVGSEAMPFVERYFTLREA